MSGAKNPACQPVLGPRLKECAEAALSVDGRSASEIFGSADKMKLKSSMALFVHALGEDAVFVRLLEKY